MQFKMYVVELQKELDTFIVKCPQSWIHDRERILRIMSSLRHLNPENTDFLLDSASRGGVTIYSIRNIGERYCFTGSFSNPAQ